MAKVWIDGFELQLREHITGSTLTFAASGRNSVGTYLQHGQTSAIGGTGNSAIVYNIPSTPLNARLNEGYMRIALLLSGAYNATDSLNTWIRFKDSAGNVIVEIVANSSGILEVYAGTGGSRILLTTISAATWYVFQIYWKLHASTGAVTVKINGTTVGTPITIGAVGATGGTLNTIETSSRHVQNTTLGYVRLDDITIHDTTGIDNVSYPPDADILKVTLASSGNSSDFLGSDGNSTNNFQLVDEVPMSASDYVESSTLNATDLYNFTAITLSSGRIITGAVIKGLARKASSTTPTGLSPTTRQGATNYPQTSAEYIFPDTVAHNINGLVMEKDPTGAAWNQTNFNSLQIGATKTT